MSEQDQAHVQTADVHPPAVAAVAVPEVPFTEQQIDQFDADDGDAGRAIGKMLALFFLYTVIVMSGVAYWTFRTGSRCRSGTVRRRRRGSRRRAMRPRLTKSRMAGRLAARTGPPYGCNASLTALRPSL